MSLWKSCFRKKNKLWFTKGVTWPKKRRLTKHKQRKSQSNNRELVRNAWTRTLSKISQLYLAAELIKLRMLLSSLRVIKGKIRDLAQIMTCQNRELKDSHLSTRHSLRMRGKPSDASASPWSTPSAIWERSQRSLKCSIWSKRVAAKLVPDFLSSYYFTIALMFIKKRWISSSRLKLLLTRRLRQNCTALESTPHSTLMRSSKRKALSHRRQKLSLMRVLPSKQMLCPIHSCFNKSLSN